MKKSRFSQSQIVAILKEVELGAKVGETCRKHGVSEATYYKWKTQFPGMTVRAFGAVARAARGKRPAQAHVCRPGPDAQRPQGRC